MKRIRLQHNYHDGQLRQVRFEDRLLVLEVDLCPVWNNKVPQKAYLRFADVHNLNEIRERFDCSNTTDTVQVVDEIIGVAKLGKTRYLIDLQRHGSLEVDCRGISEI